jgi:hypothetical protein
VTPEQFIQLPAKQRKKINKDLRHQQHLRKIPNPKTLQQMFPTIGDILEETAYIYPNGETAPELRQTTSQSPALSSTSPKLGSMSPLGAAMNGPNDGSGSPSTFSLNGATSTPSLDLGRNSANVILYREPGESWSVDQNGNIHIDRKRLLTIEELRTDFNVALTPPRRHELIRYERKYSNNGDDAGENNTQGWVCDGLDCSDDDYLKLYDQTLINTMTNVSTVSSTFKPPALESELSNSFYKNRSGDEVIQDNEQIQFLTEQTNNNINHLSHHYEYPIQPLFRACSMCKLEFKFTCSHCPLADALDMERFDLALCRKWKENGTYPLSYIYHSALNLDQLTFGPTTIANNTYHQHGVGVNVAQYNKLLNKRVGARKNRAAVTDKSIQLAKELTPHQPKSLRFAEHVIVRTIPSREMERKALKEAKGASHAGKDNKDHAGKGKDNSKDNKDDAESPTTTTTTTTTTHHHHGMPPLEKFDETTDEIMACVDQFDPEWNPNVTFGAVRGRIVDFVNAADKLPPTSLLPKSFNTIKTQTIAFNKMNNIHTDSDFVELSSQRSYTAQNPIFAIKVLRNYQKLYSFDIDHEQSRHSSNATNNNPVPTPYRKSSLSKPRPAPQVVKIKASKGVPAYSFIQNKHDIVATFEFKTMKKGGIEHQLIFCANHIDGVIIANGNKILVDWDLEYQIDPERCSFVANYNKATLTITLGLAQRSQKWAVPFSAD